MRFFLHLYSMITIYYNPSCSKCNIALDTIKQHTTEYEIVEYLQDTPSEDELSNLLKKIGCNAFDIVRTNEPLYQEKYANKCYSEQQWIKILHENPVLIQRPIIVNGSCAIVGRTTESLEQIIKL